MEWTATQLVTVCLHDAGTRNELGPVDVLKSCQGRWPVYFAQSPSTPPHSLHQQVKCSAAQYAAAKVSQTIPVEWTRCDSVCQYPRLGGQGNDSVVY